MEIQVNTRIPNSSEDLVLHFNVQRVYGEEHQRFNKVTSAIYETNSEGKPNREDPIFQCSGTGDEELETTLTFIDFLLIILELPQLDLEVVDWLFETQIDEIGGRSHLRYKIFTKVAYVQDFGESEFRLLSDPKNESPNVVSIGDN